MASSNTGKSLSLTILPLQNLRAYDSFKYRPRLSSGMNTLSARNLSTPTTSIRLSDLTADGVILLSSKMKPRKSYSGFFISTKRLLPRDTWCTRSKPALPVSVRCAVIPGSMNKGTPYNMGKLSTKVSVSFLSFSAFSCASFLALNY